MGIIEGLHIDIKTSITEDESGFGETNQGYGVLKEHL